MTRHALNPRLSTSKKVYGVAAIAATLSSGCLSETIVNDTLQRATTIAPPVIAQWMGKSGTNPANVLIAMELAKLAQTAIGKALAKADQERARAAAQQAMEQREAAARQAAAEREARVDQQLRAELAKARNETERARAQQRAAEERERALRESMAQTQGPTVAWNGDANSEVSGSAQAIGPTQVAGRTDCEKVRELAIIRGKEVRQEAIFCKDPQAGGRVRV